MVTGRSFCAWLIAGFRRTYTGLSLISINYPRKDWFRQHKSPTNKPLCKYNIPFSTYSDQHNENNHKIENLQFKKIRNYHKYMRRIKKMKENKIPYTAVGCGNAHTLWTRHRWVSCQNQMGQDNVQSIVRVFFNGRQRPILISNCKTTTLEYSFWQFNSTVVHKFYIRKGLSNSTCKNYHITCASI